MNDFIDTDSGMTPPEDDLTIHIPDNDGQPNHRTESVENASFEGGSEGGCQRPKIFPFDATILPDRQMTHGGRPARSQALTVANLEKIVEILHYQLWWDEQTHQFQYYQNWCGGKILTHHDVDAAEAEIRDALTVCGILGKADYYALCCVIAKKTRHYHAMLDWVESSPWDGIDRIQTLADTLPVDKMDITLRDVYVRRWLIQVMQGIAGWDLDENTWSSLPHVLVLTGEQGVGKTSWFARLAPGFVKTEAELHLNTSFSKDHQIAALKFPIVELAEIDATFRKSDVSALKAFLSREDDEIRAPYERKAHAYRRGTAFCGSVNDPEFLKDLTGNRRFWPINVTGKIDFRHDINMQQLWAQALVLWESGENWTLNDEEIALHKVYSEKFRSISSEEEMLNTWVNARSGLWLQYGAATITQIMDVVGIPKNNLTIAIVRHWLMNNYGNPHKVDDVKRAWPFPVKQSDFENIHKLSAHGAWRRVRKLPAWQFVPKRSREEPPRIKKDEKTNVTTIVRKQDKSTRGVPRNTEKSGKDDKNI